MGVSSCHCIPTHPYTVSLLFHDFLCSFQSNIDIRTDIFFAQQSVKARLLQYLVYLFIDTRKYNLDIILLTHFAETAQVVYTG